MRILAIQLNQPGDAILTTPVLRWLMNQGHDVHVMVQPVSADLLSTMEGLGGIHPLPRGSLQFSRDLDRWRLFRTLKFDRAIVFARCSERPALWAWLSGAPRRTALLNENFPALLRPLCWINDWQRYPHWAIHVVEQHLALAGATPEDAAVARLEYRPTGDARAWRDAWLRTHNLTAGSYLHFHLTARWMGKCWPIEHVRTFLQQAATQLPQPIVITTGPAQFEVDYAQQALAGASNIVSEIGTLKPHQLGAIIETCGAFLGMDSMPMHLAAALGKPGVALFGDTNSPQWRPWQAPFTLHQATGPRRKLETIAPQDAVQSLRELFSTAP